jgi:hypothetical protein
LRKKEFTCQFSINKFRRDEFEVKKFLAVLLISVIFVVPIQNVFASSDNVVEEQLTVKKVSVQVLSLNSNVDQATIDMYTDGGWVYDKENNQLVREVTYEGEEIKIDGETYETDKNGEIQVAVDNPKITVEVENTLNSDEQKLIEVDAELEKDITMYENMDLNNVIEGMADPNEALQSDNPNPDIETPEGDLQVGGVENGELPKRGQRVHCNRFNGFTGNGRYYSSKTYWRTIQNFFQSDCDVALVNSTKCYHDYDSNINNRYCSTKNTTTAGYCSKYIVKHGVGYHKHTGWFSPAS